jgi:hypothetical protein
MKCREDRLCESYRVASLSPNAEPDTFLTLWTVQHALFNSLFADGSTHINLISAVNLVILVFPHTHLFPAGVCRMP